MLRVTSISGAAVIILPLLLFNLYDYLVFQVSVQALKASSLLLFTVGERRNFILLQRARIVASSSQTARMNIFGLALGLLLCISIGCRQTPLQHSRPVKVNGQRRVIVFVHGVVGDVDGTWRNSTTKAYWPELFAHDKQLSDYDVYAFSYYSPSVRSAQNVYEISTQLFTELQDKRFFAQHDEIYIVAHSMGGLITKAMLSSVPCRQSELLCRVPA